MKSVTSSSPRSANVMFHADVRERVEAYHGGDSKLKIAVERCPAIAVAIVTGHGTDEQRERAERLMIAGKRQAAEAALGLPPWLNHIQPAAFDGNFSHLPSSPLFDVEILQFFPDKPDQHPAFLAALRAGKQHADEEYCLWLAREMRTHRIILSTDLAGFLAVYAWMSRNLSSSAAKWLQAPWTTRMALPVAARQTNMWVFWLAFGAMTGPEGLGDTWCRGGNFRGYEITPLRTVEDYIEAAVKLSNCVYSYAEPVMANECRLFLVSKDGEPVAMTEIGRHEMEGLTKQQTRGLRNARVPSDVHRAVYAFLAESDPTGCDPFNPREPMQMPPDSAIAQRWRELTGAYFAARPDAVVIPMAASCATLRRMLQRARSLVQISQNDLAARMLRRRR